MSEGRRNRRAPRRFRVAIDAPAAPVVGGPTPAVSRSRRAWRSQRGAGVTCFVLAVLFAVLAVGAADDGSHIGPASPTAQATVVDVIPLYRRSEVAVEFRTQDGRDVRARTDEYRGMPEVGDVLTVQYDPADPEAFVRELGDDTNRVYVVLFAGLTGALVVGGVLGLRGRLPRWALNR
ncbi:hypothetical protein HP550_04810 [Cellulomonas humilata]|uniref:DUF3592 domain-containing protein n=1 Tax=Cellulomonas humilata TaxID=144055 RepID=A0A7Y6DVL2_9CELL|nr:DUF3592 domain-containing protein [Cellulomonas humilata]NUU16566.1 hypothetical protein [Cellulomonas humilata]